MTTDNILTLISSIGFFTVFIGIIIGFVINLVYLKNVRKFLNYLRDKHSDKWQALSEPTVFVNNSPRNTIRVWRYIQKEEYKEIGDEKLNGIGTKVRRQLRFAILYFIVLLVLFFIVFISIGVNSN
jgi:predicted PurR-regulated permease PerM